MATGMKWVDTRDAAQHSAIHRIDPIIKNQEQSLTGRHWNSPKKISNIQRQRRSHNEMVGGAQSQ